MHMRTIKRLALSFFSLFSLAVLISAGHAQKSSGVFAPTMPKTWDVTALEDWATPVAELNVRPTHMSAKDYYSMPVENLRTYPVYFPDREPDGYWEMLQGVGPKPLIEPEKLKTEADWIEAGRIVFDEVDDLHLRTFAPELIAAARSPKTFENRQALPDGTVSDLRWVATKDGVALSIPNCASCHLQRLPDGTRVPGAPTFGTSGSVGRSGLTRRLQTALRSVTGAPPFRMGAESFGMWLYQAYGVPWRKDDIHE